jgi:hypothetical protein
MEKIKEIYQTYNYDMFQFMKGNRAINQKKLKRMLKRMKNLQDSGIMPFLLIRVTNTKKTNIYEILDGQHTYLVMKSLGLPINFYICKDEGINEVRIINSDMTNWNIWDYVVSNADTGNENYIKLLNLKETYSHFYQTELFVGLAINKYRDLKTVKKDIIKNGKFEFKNYYEVLKTLDQLSDFKFIQGAKYTDYLFIRAMLYFISYKNYDHERMISQLRKYPNIVKATSIDEYIQILLKKYNYNKRNNEKLDWYKLQKQKEKVNSK